MYVLVEIVLVIVFIHGLKNQKKNQIINHNYVESKLKQ
jgi:hypothetical protein